MDQAFQQIQQFLQLLQYGAYASIAAVLLLMIILCLVLNVMTRLRDIETKQQVIENGTRYNSMLLQEIARRMQIPLPPLYP